MLLLGLSEAVGSLVAAPPPACSGTARAAHPLPAALPTRPPACASAANGGTAALAGVLRGCGRQKYGAWANLFVNWVLGLGCMVVFAFRLNMGVVGAPGKQRGGVHERSMLWRCVALTRRLAGNHVWRCGSPVLQCGCGSLETADRSAPLGVPGWLASQVALAR